MQTAYYTLTRTTLVVLHKLRIYARRAVTLLVVSLYEIPAGVRKHLRLDYQQSVNRCLDNIHDSIPIFESGYKITAFFWNL